MNNINITEVVDAFRAQEAERLSVAKAEKDARDAERGILSARALADLQALIPSLHLIYDPLIKLVGGSISEIKFHTNDRANPHLFLFLPGFMSARVGTFQRVGQGTRYWSHETREVYVAETPDPTDFLLVHAAWAGKQLAKLDHGRG